VTDPGALIAAAAEWRDHDPDPVTRTELAMLVGQRDIQGLRSRFEGSLTFGTAGIRAELGAGPLRMNRLVVARVAVGLGRHLADRAPTRGRARVAIGYDGRTNSKVFAADAARVLCRAGCAVSLLPRALPTPVLAFAVRHLRADLGLMVTASHNPRAENGLKLYVADGGQLLPPLDAEIAAAVDAVELSSLPEGWEDGPCPVDDADGVVDAYVEAIAGAAPPGPDAPRRTSSLVVVHTALHGVGTETLRAVLEAGGWPPPHSVPHEARPDPAFPGMPFPNPEEPGVLDGARAMAEAIHADLVVANDPDADRLAVMVPRPGPGPGPRPGPGGYERLTGDELGVLLADDVLARLAAAGPPDLAASGGEAPPPVVATTVVSGSLLRKMADRAGVRCVTTLTGFKWIVRAAGPDGRLVYGYEEALGYAVRPDVVADKDGISAALRVVELAGAAQCLGRTLRDRLDDLALRHGLHVTCQRAVRVGGAEGMARLARALEAVRRSPPSELGGGKVVVTDLRAARPGVVDLAGGAAERWPGAPHGPADVLVWHVGDAARVVLRPSGTEPKLKIYVEVATAVEHASELGDRRASSNARAGELASAAVDALGVIPAD
jgi:phosphomannomutase